MRPNQPSSPLTVSQLNRQVKQLLETQYPAIPVQGEISTLSRPASGHIYFTLKDQNAQIRCAMFKSSLLRTRYVPKQGDEVVVYGRISLYEGRGDYQLIASTLQPVGEGALQAAFFKLKERLGAEGLFDETHKKPLPNQIKTVGIVTSSTGAALHDITTVLNRRFPAIQVILYPSQVQGNEASATIVKAIEAANARNEVDVLIVGRGGGSLEDLWCFNTEPVARAIYESKLPIISAVGHEVDISIADFVADHRAATPSQAAELVSPDQFERMQRLDNMEQRLLLLIQRQLKQHQTSLASLQARLKGPEEKVRAWRERLNTLQNRLRTAILRSISTSHSRTENLAHRLNRTSPNYLVAQNRVQLTQISTRLQAGLLANLDPKRTQFQKLVAKLNVLSPLSTLERGYSITRSLDGKVIQDAKSLSENDDIETQLQSGRVISKVQQVLPK